MLKPLCHRVDHKSQNLKCRGTQENIGLLGAKEYGTPTSFALARNSRDTCVPRRCHTVSEKDVRREGPFDVHIVQKVTGDSCMSGARVHNGFDFLLITPVDVPYSYYHFEQSQLSDLYTLWVWHLKP